MILRSVTLLLAIGAAAEALWKSSLGLACLAALLGAAAFASVDWPTRACFLGGRFYDDWRAVDMRGIAGALVIGAVVLGVAAVALTWHDTFSLLAIVAWVAAIFAMVVAAARLDGVTVASARAWLATIGARTNRPELLSVLAIMVVGLGMRLYGLGGYPPQFHGDEGELGLLAIRLIRGEHFPFFSTSGFAGLPFFFNYLQAGSMLVFGQSVTGLRMLSVIAGVASIPVVYAIGRVAWGPLAGATAAWLLAVSHLHSQYSRMALSNVEATLTTASMVLLLMVAYRASDRKVTVEETQAASHPSLMGRPGIWLLLVLAGIAIALGQYVYVAARVMPVMAAPLLFVLWRTRRATVAQVASFGFAAAVLLAPLASHYVYRPEQFGGRVDTVSVFSPQAVQNLAGKDASLPGALPVVLGIQVQRVFGMFLTDGDAGGFYWRNDPAFDAGTAILLWLGIGAALGRFRRFPEVALLCWFWLGIILGGVFTIDQPAAQRLLLMVPAVYLFGGLAVVRAWQVVQGLPLERLRWLAVPLGTSAALLLLSTNITTYFTSFGEAEVGVVATASARELARDAPRYHAYLLTAPTFYENHGAVKFIARDVPITMLRTGADFQPPPQDGRGVVIVATEQHLQDLRTIEAQAPGGEESRRLNPQGKVVYIAYRVPPATGEPGQ